MATFFLLTRVPRATLFNSPLLRLGLYSSVVFGEVKVLKMIRRHQDETIFKNFSLKYFGRDELGTLNRAFLFKRNKLAEDRKNLKKFKFDPQSYH